MKKLELVRDTAKEFPDIEEPENYTELRVWHCKYESLEEIRNFTKLETLEIATLPNDDLRFLKDLHYLKRLRILHLPKVKDIEPLSSLGKLQELELATLPSWDSSGKHTIITSLKPLSKLKELIKLTLYGVLPADNNFLCLAECPALEELNLQKKLHTLSDELQQLHRLKPELKGNFLNLI